MDFPGHQGHAWALVHAQAATAQDPYKTLGEQGVDVKGEVQYTVEPFSVGTKNLGRKPKEMGFNMKKMWLSWAPRGFDKS